MALASMAEICFRISSGCRAGASPANGERRQPERLPYKQRAIATVVRRRKAEREREGSAAGSIQRTKKRRVGRYRVIAEQQVATDAR